MQFLRIAIAAMCAVWMLPQSAGMARHQSTTRTGVITGRILLLDGTPLVGVRVSVLQESGKDAALMGLGETDPDGRYRLEGIPAGTYFLAAGPLDAPAYFPGVYERGEAKSVTVVAGAALDGVDFHFKGPLAPKVSGRVLREGHQAGEIVVLAGGPPPFQSTPIRPDGTFEFRTVRPGEYQLWVAPTINVGALPPVRVVVGHEDIAGVEVLVPVAAVTEVKADFSAMVEGGGPRPQFRLRFDASGAAPTVPSNGYPMPILSTDSTFSMIVPLGEYRVSLTNIPAGFSIKSFTAGSVDLTKEPLKIALPGVPPIVIVFTKPPWMKVIGRVTGIENSPIRATQITMTTTTLASPQTAPVAADGSFEFPTLLPGVYRVQLTPAADPFNRFVTVSADGSPVEIPMAIPAWRVSGRVVVGSNETIPAGMQIQLAPEVFVPGRMSFTTAVNSDGSFFFSAVQPGRYLASISVCRGDVCIGGPPSVGQGIITVDSDRIDLVINR